jgi:hypothetical protein
MFLTSARTTLSPSQTRAKVKLVKSPMMKTTTMRTKCTKTAKLLAALRQMRICHERTNTERTYYLSQRRTSRNSIDSQLENQECLSEVLPKLQW